MPSTSVDPGVDQVKKLDEVTRQRKAEIRNKAETDMNVNYVWTTWDFNTIKEYEIGKVDKYWLDLRGSFSTTTNKLDDQPHFPFTGKAFIF